MDAKSKASFINSVAGGQVVPCPVCGTANSPENKVCSSCGAEIAAIAAASDAPAFAPAVSDPGQAAGENARYTEPVSVFADGLPSWDIVPPQIMVRRR